MGRIFLAAAGRNRKKIKNVRGCIVRRQEKKQIRAVFSPTAGKNVLEHFAAGVVHVVIAITDHYKTLLIRHDYSN